MVKSKQTKFVYDKEQTDQMRAWLRANRTNLCTVKSKQPNSCLVKSKQTKFVYG